MGPADVSGSRVGHHLLGVQLLGVIIVAVLEVSPGGYVCSYSLDRLIVRSH